MPIKEQDNLPKKASKRFAYPVSACIELNKTRENIQIQNISKTGIQFFSKASIPNHAQLRLMWQDPQIGPLEIHLLVVRTVQLQDESTFPFGYGSKFVNLKDDVRKNVNRVVETTAEHELENYKKMLDTISFRTIFDIITHGRAFLRDLLKGKKSSGKIDQFALDLKEYEKQSFAKDDDVSLWLQKLVTQSFHSHILSVVLSSTTKIADLQKLVTDKIQSMDCLVKECQQFIESKKATGNKMPSELHESLHRVMYARLELLETFNKRVATSSMLKI